AGSLRARRQDRVSTPRSRLVDAAAKSDVELSHAHPPRARPATRTLPATPRTLPLTTRPTFRGVRFMLNLWGKPAGKDCEGTSRREVLRVGALGLTGLSLSGLLRLRSAAAATGQSVKDTSVVWIWLGGGPTHIETFDPKMDAPAEYRSTVGAVKTCLPGVQIGGLLPEMARRAKQMAFVRSFAHGNSGHAGGTHFVMTGTDHPPADNGAPQIKPSLGSITARVRGANNPRSGIPTYVRLAGLYAD